MQSSFTPLGRFGSIAALVPTCVAVITFASEIATAQTFQAPSKQEIAQTATPGSPVGPVPSILPPVIVDAPPKKTVKKQAAPKAAKSNAGSGTPPVATGQPQVPAVVKEGLATPPIVERYQLPQKSFSTTARQIEETINLKDPEDAVKYMPSLFVRKRNDGDNQAVLATRSWGLNSSARTLIYQDDLLISALIGNNNSGASPHWNLVSPEVHCAD